VGGLGAAPGWVGQDPRGGRERGGRREGRGREGDLTSGLDDRRQALTGIPPRARGYGREVEESKREVAAREKKMRERGHVGGRQGRARGWAAPRARNPLLALTSNQI
jgi:hypothetical protein